MKISRRNFLRYTAGTGLAFGLGGTRLLHSPALHARERSPMSAGNPLRVPPVHTGGTIRAAETQQEVWPGITTDVWTYGGTFPGPTFSVERGSQFSVQLLNDLKVPTNIHWHGLIVPATMDGHPRDVISEDQTFDYAFTVNQRAGTYWYHPHPHMMTGEQVYRGMAGFFIVHDSEEAGLGLPTGEYDLPLLIQDHRVDSARSFAYAPTHTEMATGFLGDVVLANGTPDAVLNVARGVYRFRVLNGANARIFDLALSDNAPFHVIGTDGGLLDKPYQVTHSFLAPAERLEILIDFSAYAIGSTVTLRSRNYGGGNGRQQGAAMPILQFNVTHDGGVQSIPSTLASIERLDAGQAVRTREFRLKVDHSTHMPEHQINERAFDMERIDERIPLGDLEIWTFSNPTQEPHPMHIHGAFFQVLDINESTDLEPRDMGWKDTLHLPSFTTARVLVRFTSHLGVYMVHCHNLEHEDAGMMSNIEVVQESAVEDLPDVRNEQMNLR